jgi:2-phosphosulfolactate phosphatase
MDILTFFTPAEMAGQKLTADTAIVIDVLLGTTTISAALKAGASKVITVSEVDEAVKLADELGRKNTLIGGNQGISEISGFDINDSPGEYSLNKIQRKNLVYCSPDIAGAVTAARLAGRVLLGSFNNMQAVLQSAGSPLTLHILCAGKDGRFSLEDAVCAGMFIQQILNKAEVDFSLNDASSTARYLYYRHHRNILSMLTQSSYGSYLSRLGRYKDIEYAGMINIANIVPELSPDKSHFAPTVKLEKILQNY